jgi:hypothetical protein
MSSGKTHNLIGAGVLASSLLRAGLASANGARLLVFIHTSIKQRALQGMLQDSLPHLTVTAVGRVADFERSLKDGQDAVLTLPLVMQAHGMKPQVRGTHGGANDESYSLVGVGRPPDLTRISSVGALDLLDRRGTTGFVRDLVDREVKVERVTKVEDLLPLLQLERAEAVLLPTRMLSEVRSQSSLALEARALPTRLGLPALANVGANGALAIAETIKLSGEPARLLGVNGWK